MRYLAAILATLLSLTGIIWTGTIALAISVGVLWTGDFLYLASITSFFIPTAFVSFIVYNIWKSKPFYERHEKSIRILLIGTICTFVISLATLLIMDVMGLYAQKYDVMWRFFFFAYFITTFITSLKFYREPGIHNEDNSRLLNDKEKSSRTSVIVKILFLTLIGIIGTIWVVGLVGGKILEELLFSAIILPFFVPTLFLIILSFKLLRDKSFYNKNKRAFDKFARAVGISLIVSMVIITPFTIPGLRLDRYSIELAIAIFVWGIVISLCKLAIRLSKGK
ncbi:MAG: hypothetical protein KC506_02115 [Nanoarchaeota archaeon]|nr:hypothetical protein [Nanoarchaeota archaeon]